MEFQRIETLKSERLSPAEKNESPNFVSRVSYYKIPSEIAPVRGYLHVTGYSNFVDLSGSHDASHNLKEHLVETLCLNSDLSLGADFFLAAVWGSKKDKMIDLFKYTDTTKWPKNPDVSTFVFKNGVYQPDRKVITCGDTLIMLGAEEQFRRTTKSLDKYIEGCPKIPGLCSD